LGYPGTRGGSLGRHGFASVSCGSSEPPSVCSRDSKRIRVSHGGPRVVCISWSLTWRVWGSRGPFGPLPARLAFLVLARASWCSFGLPPGLLMLVWCHPETALAHVSPLRIVPALWVLPGPVCGSFGSRVARSGHPRRCQGPFGPPRAECGSYEPCGARSVLVVLVWTCLSPAGVYWSKSDSRECR